MSNRVIKFRGYSHAKREWVYGYYVSDGVSYWIAAPLPNFTTSAIAVSPESLGQFTGLHDKNGVEVYEGDIIQLYYSSWLDEVSTVIFEDGTFGYSLDDGLFTPLTLLHIDTTRENGDHFRQAIKVIGNVYENPELLEEQS